MDEVMPTYDNKNDWMSLACLPPSPLGGSNFTIIPRGFEARATTLVNATDASTWATLAKE